MAAPDDLDFNHESGYTAPGFEAVAFKFPYAPPPAITVLFEHSEAYETPYYQQVHFKISPPEPYKEPPANRVDFNAISGYTAPVYKAVIFPGPQTTPTDPVDPGQPGEHTGTINATTDDAAGSATGSISGPAVNGTASAATDAVAASVEAVHGITGTGSATTDDTDAQAGGQQATVGTISATTDSNTGAAEARTFKPITATASATTDAASAAATAEHVIPRLATIAATTDAASAAASAMFEVYCLSGAVQDENGLPMERTVRAHRLDDGTLAAETVSNSAGIFDINVGFESAEFYVIALDTGPEGTDYLPPVTNRVTSVLRYD